MANHGFVAVLVAAQVVCGLWLLARPRSAGLVPVWLYLAVALLWTGLGLQGVLRGLEVANCGCFGLFLTQRLSWFVLAQDGLLLLYGYLMVRSARRARGPATADRGCVTGVTDTGRRPVIASPEIGRTGS